MRMHPVILSGGTGTRLWPLSRALYPKQLMPLAGSHSLLQETALRVDDGGRFAAPLVVCNVEHRFLVAEQLRALGLAPRDIVLEPQGRNTAPAACLAALVVAAEEPAALLLLLPSDHVIARPAAFDDALARAVPAARAGWLVTFGIAPDEAESAYGYIRRGSAVPDLPGCERVDRFVEKPDAEAARRYLDDGRHLWNSGMLLARADVLLQELERHAPRVVAACREALAGAAGDLDFLRLDGEAFAAAPAVALDRAVLEPTDRAAVVAADIGWSDVGSWATLWRIAEKDAAGNALLGEAVAVDAGGCYLRGDGRLVAALGVRDLAVVAGDDSVLVCPRERANEVARLVEHLEALGRDEVRSHRQVHRPWGSYTDVDGGPGFRVKRLTLKPGAAVSLQRHHRRAEHWVVVDGVAEVTRDGASLRLQANQSTYIPPGMLHRLRNPGTAPLHIVEVQTGDYLGEDDIERFEDLYGRD